MKASPPFRQEHPIDAHLVSEIYLTLLKVIKKVNVTFLYDNKGHLSPDYNIKVFEHPLLTTTTTMTVSRAAQHFLQVM